MEIWIFKVVDGQGNAPDTPYAIARGNSKADAISAVLNSPEGYSIQCDGRLLNGKTATNWDAQIGNNANVIFVQIADPEGQF
jgi:hypothetical protein